MEVNQTFKLQIIKRLYKSDNTDISNVITINHMSFPDKLFNNGLIRLIWQICYCLDNILQIYINTVIVHFDILSQ